MNRRMVLLWLLAGMPALVCAQEAKVVNCRTLAAAGNFLGPDEIIVNDLVCQKVKGAAEATSQVQAPKAQPGAVVSESGETTSVVDAAKAANKRVAAAQDAIKGKTAAPAEEEKPGFVPVGPMAPTVTPEPAPAAEPAKTPETVPSAKPKMRLPLKAVVPEIDANAKPPAEQNKSEAQSAAELAPAKNSAESSTAGTTEAIASPAAAVAEDSSTDSMQQIASREPAGTTEPTEQQTKPEEQKSAATAESAQAGGEDHQTECGKNKWWKPRGKCKTGESEKIEK